MIPGENAPRIRRFFPDEAERAIRSLEVRLSEVAGLQTGHVRHDDERVHVAERKIRATILEIFGENSPEYQDHQAHLIVRKRPILGGSPSAIQQQIETFGVRAMADGVPRTMTMLKGLIETVRERTDEPMPTSIVEEPVAVQEAATKKKPTKVLIVHGRDHGVRDRIDLYLTKDLSLKTVTMEEGAHSGRTLAEKFEEMAAECNFGVFIFTGDDRLKDLTSGEDLKRARQNVVLEAGFMWGAIGRRGRAAFLVEPGVDLPSDIHGVGWIPITPDLAETKIRLRRELVSAGLVSTP